MEFNIYLKIQRNLTPLCFFSIFAQNLNLIMNENSIAYLFSVLL